MMSNDKILRIVLASTVLLGLSWPAAAQQQAEGTVARLELNIAPFSAATEAGSVGRFDALGADEAGWGLDRDGRAGHLRRSRAQGNPEDVRAR